MSKCKRNRTPQAQDSWARVELYRWQHGNLPGEAGTREKPLSVPAGLEGMAAAIEKRDAANFPSPFNVMMVLRFAAKLLRERGEA
ncbi:MAG: hypothetical protein JWO82_1666 [Akkermansiaceae bacterium]|nr:hypothetical protein [Akkermansiaceae bacterium]